MVSRRALNPAFAAAHGLSTASGTKSPKNDLDSPPSAATGSRPHSKDRIDLILKQARATGKLQASNAGLTSPLPDNLFDLRDGLEAVPWDAVHRPSIQHVEETLTIVDFSDNELSGSLDDRFTKFQNVQSLRLKRCGFSGIVDLASLENLMVLDLAGNKLETFDLSMVPSALHELDLSSNNLVKLSATSATTLSSLVRWDISENNLSDLDLEMVTCEHLQSFRCNKNKLTSLPKLLEGSKDSLTELHAAHNRMESLGIDLAEFSKLQTVVVSFNRLVQVPQSSNSVSRLDLTSNKLTSLQGLLADSSGETSNKLSTPSLVELLLQDNYLSELDASVIQQCNKLQRLDLVSNKLKTLPYQLGFLDKLQHLSLSGNPLHTFKNSDLERTSALLKVLRNRAPKSNGECTGAPSKLLDSCLEHKKNGTCLVVKGTPGVDVSQLIQELQSNPTTAFEISGVALMDRMNLEQFPEELLPLLPNITELSMVDNKLTSLPLSLATSCGHLTRLNVSRNRLVNLDPLLQTPSRSNVAWSQTLVRLDVSSNRLVGFSPALLRQLPALELLNLSFNRLTSLEEWTWLPSTLTILNVSDNSLEEIASLVIVMAACCPQLQALSLENNDIRRIPPTLGLLQESASNLRHLDIKGNPQHSIRPEILTKPCDDQLHYLCNRLTAGQKDAARSRIKARQELETEATAPVASPAVNKRVDNQKSVIEESMEPQLIKAEDTSRDHAPKTGTKECGETQSTDADNVATGLAPETRTIESVKTQSITVENKAAIQAAETGAEESAETESMKLVEQYKVKIAGFEAELDSPSLSQAKRYAVKKSLAMERSKLIREERKLGLRK